MDEVNLDKFFLDPLAKHAPGVDLRKAMVGEPMITRTIDGASTLSVPVHDPEMLLLRSDLLASDNGERLRQRIDVNVDGLWFRLEGVDGEVGGTLELIHIARPVAQLVDLTAPLKARREDANYKGLTRAEFARELVRSVKGTPIGFVAPELHKRQREAGSPGVEAGGASSGRKGKQQTAFDRLNRRFPAHGLGDTAGKYRMSEGEIRMVCEVVGFTPTQAKQMYQISLGESSRYPGIVASDNGIGLFQITPWACGPVCRKWIADLGGNAEMRNPVKNAIVALKLAKASGGGFFSPWYGTAFLDRSLAGVKSILGEDVDLGDLSGSGGGPEVRTEKPYEFAVGPPDGPRGENYWEALQRLAADVNWRCFEVGGRIHFVSEDDLFAAAPRATIRPGSPGVERISMVDFLRGRRVQEVEIQARAGRWAAPPGSTVEFEKCGPIDGKWLVVSIERPVFSSLATITVQKPEKPKLEPPNEVRTKSLPGPADDPTMAEGGKAARLYEACRAISRTTPGYLYGGGHGPALSSLSGGQRLDCSSSTSLALYRAGLMEGNVAQVSGWFAANYGKRGRGKHFTIWANDGHVWIEFHGLGDFKRFDTGGPGGGAGPKVRTEGRSTGGFTPRHYPGL